MDFLLMSSGGFKVAALKNVTITGSMSDGKMQVLGLEKETAEVISAGEENQQHRGQQEALHWTFPQMAPLARAPWDFITSREKAQG